MKRYRILFVLAATLLFATPSFAQLCGYCDRWGDCWAWPGLGTACDWDINNWCYQWDEPYYCGSGGFADASALSSELAIASVEVVTPAGTEVHEMDAVRPVRTAAIE
jgi:hypothetical protein